MQTSTFLKSCPYEIGDAIETVSNIAGSSEDLYIKTKSKITDISTIHYLKNGKTEFEYELDDSKTYQRL